MRGYPRDYEVAPNAIRALREIGDLDPDLASLRILRYGGRPLDGPLAGGRRVVLPNGVKLWAPTTYRLPWWHSWLRAAREPAILFGLLLGMWALYVVAWTALGR